ncbi:MAG: AAA family ATPase [Solirubrobacteraceae bacterium]
MLLGREHERRGIERALAQARAGISSTLALIGEPGIGKTSLLEWAQERANGMQILRVRGVQSEAEIPFGSLLELLTPALDALRRIPPSRAAALETALALRPGKAEERFAVGAATLSLLAAHAEDHPVLVMVDDAQWLDGSSAQALLFAFRRLVADPVAVLITVREGEPSFLDGADLPTSRLSGLTGDQARTLLPELSNEQARRLHHATAGNPLALLELAGDAPERAMAPADAPVLVSARIARAFLRRADGLSARARAALLLAAISDTGELAMLGRAAASLGVDLTALTEAETSGLVTIRGGVVAFMHPLARAAVYADAPADQRRAVHRALAAVLPDRDIDRRAWHLAAAAVGADASASAALEHAGQRAWDRSAYATASTAFQRAATLSETEARRASLTRQAAQSAWLGGLADRAAALVQDARPWTESATEVVKLDALEGIIAAQRGPIMRGHEILVAAAGEATGDRAVEMLAEAANACFYAGQPALMLEAARRARRALPEDPSIRSRFLAEVADGMARVLGDDAAAGAAAMRAAVALAERTPELRDDPGLASWLALPAIFLRETGEGRDLLDEALAATRARTALGVLPFILNLIARDQATTERWAVAEATYREAIALARESGQRTQLTFGLSGLAWLQARRGREQDCRTCAAEALQLCRQVGTRLLEIWATAALGELELGLGNAAQAIGIFDSQRTLLLELGISDPDLSPAPDLVEAYLRVGRRAEAMSTTASFEAAARAKRQPWGLARALRCAAMIAPEAESSSLFEQALVQHERTPDVFETARTRLAYGERLRRDRSRVRAREELRAAAAAFERVGATPCLERALTELAATGETMRRRDPALRDELTPQELQIAQLLADGKTTRETAAAIFLSPKTVEYHLRHVYQKLSINSREQLAPAIAGLVKGGASPSDSGG